jgi:predicted PurR-regulated permease PerM
VEDFEGTGPSPIEASARGPTLLTKLFTGTRNFASGFFTTVLFLLFLLVYGDIFLHRLVEIPPRFSSTRVYQLLTLQNLFTTNEFIPRFDFRLVV